MNSSLTANVAILTAAKVKDSKTEQIVNRWQQFSAYLRLPSIQCIAGACFVSAAKKDTGFKLISRMEIFPNASVLATVQNSSEHRLFNNSESGQELYEDKETATLWQPIGGFLTRKNRAPTATAGVLVLAKFTCIENEKAVQNLVKVLQTYCDWVESNELTTYTYCVMTSQTASKEVLLFERYMDLPSVKTHGQTKEFKSMSKQILPWIEANRTEITRWNELDGSFVSPIDLNPTAKL